MTDHGIGTLWRQYLDLLRNNLPFPLDKFTQHRHFKLIIAATAIQALVYIAAAIWFFGTDT